MRLACLTMLFCAVAMGGVCLAADPVREELGVDGRSGCERSECGGTGKLRVRDARGRERMQDAGYIHRSVKAVTDVMVHDIFSPPVASRIYAYISVAGYEAARHGGAGFFGLEGQLNGLAAAPSPEAGKEYDFCLAAVQAILQTGRAMVISDGTLAAVQSGMLEEMRKGMPAAVFENSVAYGKKVSDHILAWAAKDHYKETRALARYDINDETGNWRPTPPSYMKAVEPHWSEMRTFVLDSARQFVPHPPTPYSIVKGSAFSRDAYDVYETVLHLTEEQRAIANFWDCNPFKMNVNGHVMFASKKISPGGHWMNITGAACRKAGADYIRSAEAYACVAVVVADAFISCWDEKYRSKAIRPETYINQYISADWMPLLQTPPFPEYTSGHSVVSACSAVLLTKLFGEAFSFADSTEMEFGIPVRQFASFKLAAEEAAISRFYGGIHFMPAIRYGLDEGERIGSFVAGRLRMREDLPRITPEGRQ